jgi:isochorismate synthase
MSVPRGDAAARLDDADGAPSLVARSEPMDARTDLLDLYRAGEGFFFERGGAGVVGRGAALTVTVPAGPDQVARAAGQARAALESIRVESGPGPVIVGALPFDGLTPATLAVPRLSVIRRPDGSVWRVMTGASDAGREDDQPLRAEPGRASPDPADGVSAREVSLEVTPVPEPAAYVEAVDMARRRIRAGELEKVVLARMLVVRSDRDLDRRALLGRLRDADPAAYTFAVHGFIGASPELLVARSGRSVHANPLAGTAARGPDPESDRVAARALLSSSKDRAEHALVAEAVTGALATVCESLAVDPEVSAMATSKVWHLSTHVRGVLRSPPPDALDLAGLLHPTPAVCGTPRAAALAAIRELEGIDRTLYAGLVGWMDTTGDGTWAVVLRCAEIQRRMALLFAGNGIMADSDPQAELAETDAKFRAMLHALGYPESRPTRPG